MPLDVLGHDSLDVNVLKGIFSFAGGSVSTIDVSVLPGYSVTRA
jgi:hypothetical protein